MPDAPAAPVNGTATTSGTNGTTVAEAKPAPKTAWDFTKDGPLKFRANNKERALDNWDSVRQRLSMTEGLEAKYSEEQKARQKAEERAARIERAKSANEDEAWQALEEEFGPDRAYAIMEARFKKLIAKEDESKKLSPAEARLRDELERTKADAAKAAAEVKKRDEEVQLRQHQEQTERYAAYLNDVIGEALEGSGLKAESAAYFMPHVAASLNRAAELGLDIEPKMVAQEVFRVQRDFAVNLLGKLSPESVVDLLESIELKQPDGKPSLNMRKAAMQAWYVRSQKKNNTVDGQTPGGQAEPVEMLESRAARRTQPNKETWADVRSMLKMRPTKP